MIICRCVYYYKFLCFRLSEYGHSRQREYVRNLTHRPRTRRWHTTEQLGSPFEAGHARFQRPQIGRKIRRTQTIGRGLLESKYFEIVFLIIVFGCVQNTGCPKGEQTNQMCKNISPNKIINQHFYIILLLNILNSQASRNVKHLRDFQQKLAGIPTTK